MLIDCTRQVWLFFQSQEILNRRKAKWRLSLADKCQRSIYDGLRIVGRRRWPRSNTSLLKGAP